MLDIGAVFKFIVFGLLFASVVYFFYGHFNLKYKYNQSQDVIENLTLALQDIEDQLARNDKTLDELLINREETLKDLLLLNDNMNVLIVDSTNRKKEIEKMDIESMSDDAAKVVLNKTINDLFDELGEWLWSTHI